LPPVLAVVAMATNSVTVVGNALRLRRFRATGGKASTPPHNPASAPAPASAGAPR